VMMSVELIETAAMMMIEIAVVEEMAGLFFENMIAVKMNDELEKSDNLEGGLSTTDAVPDRYHC